MGPRSLFTTAASIAALLTPTRDAAQIGTTDRLAVARSALHAMKLDSAALLARQVLDSATAAPRLDRIQAWLLLGVVAFYQGRDSATASDFREALAIEPELEPRGLASYDSSLVVLFEAQRRPPASNPTSSPGAADAFLDCTRGCPKDVAPPRLLDLPAGAGLPLDPFDVRHNLDSRLTVRFIVDTAGRVTPGSVTVVYSNMQLKQVERDFCQSLARARFVPARTAGHEPVRVVWQITVEFKGAVLLRTSNPFPR